MKKFIWPAFLIIPLLLLVNPLLTYINRQSPIDPENIIEEIDTQNVQAVFHGTSFKVPQYQVSQAGIDSVLGSKSDKNKKRRIEIDLSNQKLYAYSGDKKVYSFIVSTGKWGLTPTGEFKIWSKYKATLMTGGNKALNTYYYLPNVPYTMYFYNGSIPKSMGFGIHGAYWHNNFGHPMSHGCVNMRTEDAEKLFYWASMEKGDDSGTKIVIYGETPKS